jgi:hydrogenase small subunit
VNCNIVKRGALNHMGGCMKAGGVCIGCTMPGFPDSFVPFYKSAPGAFFSTSASQAVGAVIRRLRRLSNREANREHRWNAMEAIPSGWANPEPQTAVDKVVHFFYDVWRLAGAKKPGRPAGHEERYWGVDRPGVRSDHHDESATREDFK